MLKLKQTVLNILSKLGKHVSNLNEKALNISGTLAKLHSFSYALIYILLIPGFAAIYSFIPDSFYHTTVQYEQSFQDYKEQILQEITEEIKTTFKQTYQEGKTEFMGYVIEADFFSPVSESLFITNEEVIFRLDIKFTKIDEEKSTYTAPKIKMPLRDWIDNYEVEYRPVTVITPLDDSLSGILFPSSPKENSLKELFSDKYKEEASKKIYLPISRELNNKIIGVANGSVGFPSSIKGGFFRMTYLSAVTITTLGYGDILPITPTSRFLISVEALSGIILIGLFLNALSHEASEKIKE